IGAAAGIRVEMGLLAGKLLADRKIRANEISILLALQRDVLQPQLKTGNLVGLGVGDEPIIGIAAVIAGFHNARKVVDGLRILHRFTSAHKFRNSVGIVSEEGG